MTQSHNEPTAAFTPDRRSIYPKAWGEHGDLPWPSPDLTVFEFRGVVARGLISAIAGALNRQNLQPALTNIPGRFSTERPGVLHSRTTGMLVLSHFANGVPPSLALSEEGPYVFPFEPEEGDSYIVKTAAATWELSGHGIWAPEAETRGLKKYPYILTPAESLEKLVADGRAARNPLLPHNTSVTAQDLINAYRITILEQPKDKKDKGKKKDNTEEKSTEGNTRTQPHEIPILAPYWTILGIIEKTQQLDRDNPQGKE